MKRLKWIVLCVALLLLSQTAFAQDDSGGKQPLQSSSEATVEPEETEEASEPITLDFENRNGENWRDWIDALTEVGLIDEDVDGELVFEAEMTSTSMGGPFNISEESESTYPNFAASALMSFRPEDQENNLCGFTVRVAASDDNPFEKVFFVGVDAFDYILVINYDSDHPDADSLVAEAQAPEDVLFHQPQYFGFVLNDNHVTVFVNGVSVIDNVEVDLPEPDADGEVDASYAGATLEYSCVMTSA